MKSLVRQRGISMWGLAGLMLILAFVVYVGLKLFPIYYQQFRIAHVLQGVKAQAEASGISASEIREDLWKKFDTNDITVVSPKDAEISAGEGGGTKLGVYAEVREHLFLNIDLVVTIDESVEF